MFSTMKYKFIFVSVFICILIWALYNTPLLSSVIKNSSSGHIAAKWNHSDSLSARPVVYMYWYPLTTHNFNWLNYLSAVSVLKFLNPSSLFIFLYGPQLPHYYFTLDVELKQQYDNVHFVQLNRSIQDETAVIFDDILVHFRQQQSEFGVIVGSDTVLGPQLWQECLDSGLERDCYTSLSEQGVFISAAKRKYASSYYTGYFVFKQNETSLNLLQTAVESLTFSSPGHCVDHFGEETDWSLWSCITAIRKGVHNSVFNENITPEDVFRGTSPIHRFVRHLLYNRSDEFPPPQRLKQAPIPNDVHTIWFGNREFQFMNYLSFKSILAVVNPRNIFIHGDVQPFGPNWDRIKHDRRVHFVLTQQPTEVMGINFTGVPVEHKADVARLQILHEHGGLYSDFDVFWVKSIDHFRFYDVDLIASYDLAPHCVDFPNIIQIGVFLAQKGAEFLRLWYEGYRDYSKLKGHWAAMSMCNPYKIYERRPERVMIDLHLQVIWFNGLERFIPRWLSFEETEKIQLQLNDAYAWHIPDMPINVYDESSLKAELNKPSVNSSIFYKILRFIHELPDPVQPNKS